MKSVFNNKRSIKKWCIIFAREIIDAEDVCLQSHYQKYQETDTMYLNDSGKWSLVAIGVIIHLQKQQQGSNF